MPLELLQDTDLSLLTIAPHQSSSYPEYLSPTWDEHTQRAVVWTRLRENHKLANHSLAKINEHYCALHQEQQTQVESSHKPLSCDIKSNLTMASRAEKFSKLAYLSIKGENATFPRSLIKSWSLKKSETRQDILYTTKAHFSLSNLTSNTVSGLLLSTTTRKAAGNPINSLPETLASISQITRLQTEVIGDPSMTENLTRAMKKTPRAKGDQKA